MVVAQVQSMCTLSTLSAGMQFTASNFAKYVSFEAFLAEAVGLGTQELRQLQQKMGAEGDGHRSLVAYSLTHGDARTIQATSAWRGIDLSVVVISKTCQLPLSCGLPWWHQWCFGTHSISTCPQSTIGSCWLLARLLWPPPMQLGTCGRFGWHVLADLFSSFFAA